MLPEKPDQMLRRDPRRQRRAAQSILLGTMVLEVTPGTFMGTFPIRFVPSLFRHSDIFFQRRQPQNPEHMLTFLFAPGTDAESGLHEQIEGPRLGLHRRQSGQSFPQAARYRVG